MGLNLMTLGASDIDNNLAEWAGYCSNTKYIDIFAPGKDITTARVDTDCNEVICRNDLYATKSGTSFASPIVAGAAALVWSHYPDLSPAQVHNRLVENAAILTSDESDLRVHTKDERMEGQRLLDIYWALTAPEKIIVRPTSPSVREDCENIDQTVPVAVIKPAAPKAGSYRYSLSNSVPFTIDEDTGEIFSIGDGPQCPFDFDIAKDYDLSIRVEGSDGYVFTESLLIKVLEVPKLLELSIPNVDLSGAFDPEVRNYIGSTQFFTSSIEIQATPEKAGQQIKINGTLIESSSGSLSVPLSTNQNVMIISVINDAGDAQQTYEFIIDRGVTTTVEDLKAPNVNGFEPSIDAEDGYGRALAFNGNILVVGVPGEDSANNNPLNNDAYDAGVVYIYEREDSSSWSPPPQYLKSPNPTAGDKFGSSVALMGDNFLAVGSPGNNQEAGAVFIYSRTEQGWEFATELHTDVSAGDQFGSQLAADGSLLLVSAPYTDMGSSTDVGKVYLFERTNTGWLNAVELIPDIVTSYDYFGKSIAIDNGWVAVGAPGYDDLFNGVTRIDGGLVYLFRYQEGEALLSRRLSPSNNDSGDHFSSSIALQGHTLVVSAIGEDSSVGIAGSINPSSNDTPDSGAVYVFNYQNDIWRETSFLKAINADEGDQFGISLALGNTNLVIGAYKEDAGNSNITNNDLTDSGAAYLFTRVDQAWGFNNSYSYLKASPIDAFDEFGYRLVLVGDELIVSAPNEASGQESNTADNSAQGAGAIYIIK